jgi:hypothetical protein
MPTASDRSKTASANRKLGGSRSATNETKVSNATAANPRRNAQAMPKPEKPNAAPKGADKATGPDHPSQSEHAKALYEKLHGTSAKQNEHPSGGPPGKGKRGGYGGGFSNHQGPKSGPPRRTQGKGG